GRGGVEDGGDLFDGEVLGARADGLVVHPGGPVEAVVDEELAPDRPVRRRQHDGHAGAERPAVGARHGVYDANLLHLALLDGPPLLALLVLEEHEPSADEVAADPLGVRRRGRRRGAPARGKTGQGEREDEGDGAHRGDEDEGGIAASNARIAGRIAPRPGPTARLLHAYCTPTARGGGWSAAARGRR